MIPEFTSLNKKKDSGNYGPGNEVAFET